MIHNITSISRIAMIEAAARKHPRIRRLELILTEGCNLGCSYCYEYGADHKKSMPLEIGEHCVHQLFSKWSRQAASVGITFMGGEPLIKVDLIKELIAYSNSIAPIFKKQVSFGMQTNGVLLNEEIASFLAENNVQYCLSLDGGRVTNDRFRKSKGGAGSFSIVAEKMPMLKRYQYWQGTRMTVTPEDAHLLGQNIKLLHEDLKINQFVIGFATHVPWTDAQVNNYLIGLKETFDYFFQRRVLHRSRLLRIGFFELGAITDAYQINSSWGCGAGSGRLAVTPDGILHGCSKLAWGKPGGTAEAPLALGNHEEGFTKPENREKLLNVDDKNRVKCFSCELKRHCNGGCYAANIVDTGAMYVPADYFCKLMFVQKQASEYARQRMREAGISDLGWSREIRDLDIFETSS